MGDLPHEAFMFSGHVEDLRPLFEDYNAIMHPTHANREADIWAIEPQGNHLRKLRV